MRAIAKFSTPPAVSDPLPTLATWGLTSDAQIIAPGEAAARKRLGRFLDGPLFDYGATRNVPLGGANPWSQTKRFDPDGKYIKRWVPGLRDVPAAKLCEPPAPGLALAKGYPRPMVDHHREREVALEMFRR